MSLFEGENWDASSGNRPSLTPPKTLEDVMGSIQRHPDLREARRREIMSALRGVARCIGRTQRDITVVPTTVFQKQMREAKYMQAGFTLKRWTNMRSLTVNALTLVGVATMPGRHRRSVFSEGWKALRRASNFGTTCVKFSLALPAITKSPVNRTASNEYPSALSFRISLRRASITILRSNSVPAWKCRSETCRKVMFDMSPSKNRPV